jgi:hypothetical protein
MILTAVLGLVPLLFGIVMPLSLPTDGDVNTYTCQECNDIYKVCMDVRHLMPQIF